MNRYLPPLEGDEAALWAELYGADPLAEPATSATPPPPRVSDLKSGASPKAVESEDDRFYRSLFG